MAFYHFIVMARDECGDEFRPSNQKHENESDAYAEMETLADDYPECRGLWVEELPNYRALAMARSERGWDE